MKPAALVLLLLLCPAAHAATCTASSSGVAFGSYTPNQLSPVDSAGSIALHCSKGALDILPLTIGYSIEISRGGAAGFSPRTMKSGANPLHYNLYSDALRVNVWGDGTGGTTTASGSLLILPAGTGSANHNVYGRIFASQNAVPGTFSDVIVVTVSY